MALELLWKRELTRYPAPAYRWLLLVVTTIVTVALYYNFYVLGSASTLVIEEFHWSLDTFIYVGAAASLFGAFSAVAASLGDRFGRANLLIVASAASFVCAFAMSHMHNSTNFIVLYCLLGLFEGFALVMSSTLIRDFSPRVGRGLAMGLWTVGPVGGSYIASKVAGHLLATGHGWRDLYTVAVVTGVIAWVISVAVLRDLSPRMRNAVIVQAEGSSVEVAHTDAATATPTSHAASRQLTLADRFPVRLLVPAAGVSLYLLIYVAAVSVFPLYLVSMFGFKLATANNMMSLFWLVNVLSALLWGGLSDLLRVRKPFIAAGAVMMFVASLAFTLRLGHPTSQAAMTWILAIMGLVVACGFAPWMAAISETAEELDPTRVAYGMAIFGSVQRVIGVVVALVMPHVIGTESGWRTWWIVCLVGIVLYIPTIPFLSGAWRPRKLATTRLDAAELAGHTSGTRIAATTETSGEPA